MKRLLAGRLAGGVMVAALAVAGCGVATAQHSPGGQAAHRAGLDTAHLPKGWLPVLSARQVASARLVPRPWTLVRVLQGGTVAEIRYSSGGCQLRPKGVLVTQSGSAVTLSLLALPLRPGTVCAPNLVVGTARVHIPALKGRTLRHAPLHH